MIILLPLISIVAMCIYINLYGFGVYEFMLLISSYYILNISVGVGLHRLWSHGAFKAHKILEYILVITSTATLQGPVLAWSSDHHKHHSFTDKDQDPHSPYKYESKIMGFLWSHIGWMLFEEKTKHISRVTMVKLGRNPLLRWQLQYYWSLVIGTNIILPIILGYVIGGGIQHAFAAITFLNMGRFLQQHATFCVNSLCHFIGRRPYYDGTAGDIGWMCIFLLGENWHNFHHAFARDYRNGHKWYHLDIHKWIIFGLEKMGLVWDVVRISDERIVSRKMDLKDQFVNKATDIAQIVLVYSNRVSQQARMRIQELETSRAGIKQTITKKVYKLERASEDLSKVISDMLDNRSCINKAWLKKIERKAARIRFIAEKCDLYIPSPHYMLSNG